MTSFTPCRTSDSTSGNNFRNGPRTFLAPRARHDTERAVHVTALHDRDEGGYLVRREQMISDRILRAGLFRHIDDALRFDAGNLLSLPKEVVNVPAPVS